ncbi:MAG: 6-pyruvoyl tetrahydropterin synthase family protein [Nitrospiria bacterium]
MYKISKRFSFSASHILNNLPPHHPCGRLHGHNYVVDIVLRAPRLDETGFVVDYGELSLLKEFINSTLDHQHLNDVLPFQPSTENLAGYLYHWCKDKWTQTLSVRVSETEKTWAEYCEVQS